MDFRTRALHDLELLFEGEAARLRESGKLKACAR
jgi:hypothetical protein